MPIDKIVILVLALAFFGGISFIYWKSRQQDKKGDKAPSSAVFNSIDEDPSNKSRAQGRRVSKR